MKRGSPRKSGSKLIGGYVPTQLHDLFVKAVQHTDTDQSKFIRAAIREKLSRDLGLDLESLPR